MGVALLATPFENQIQLLALILTLLICNAARGLASRLAGGLALAATAVLYGFCNILSFDSVNSFHFMILRLSFRLTIVIISQGKINVNSLFIILFGPNFYLTAGVAWLDDLADAVGYYSAEGVFHTVDMADHICIHGGALKGQVAFYHTAVY